MNVFHVDFLFGVTRPVSVVMAKLMEIRKTLWDHHRDTIVVCSLSCPPSFGVPSTEKALIPTPNAWKMFKKLNYELKTFRRVCPGYGSIVFFSDL